ncbi:MAG: TrmH family RNA methyltransferase [Deltaproteobacteria bacterium]
MIRFVLVRPRVPENVGAAARVLRNFGHDDWVLVDPERLDRDVARRMAVGAEDLLDGVPTVSTLDEAVKDCAWVVGTESRRVRGRPPFEPEALAVAAAEAAPRGTTALVFGGERDGLRAGELARCDALSRIPSRSPQPSLNLAQAVAVYAFALRPGQREPRGSRDARPASAEDAELLRVEGALRDALAAGGFLRGPERHAVRDLSRTLRRAHLTRREARLWIAAMRRVARRENG